MHVKVTKLLVTTFILLFFFQLSESLAQTDWKMFNTRTGGRALLGISGSSPKDVFAVGVDGTVRRYDGTVDDLKEINSGTGETLNAVWGDYDDGIFVVGDNGTARYLYKTTDPEIMAIPTAAGQNPPHLYGIWGISKKNLFAVGATGTILRYDGDGDDNNTFDFDWETMKNPDVNTYTLKSIWGISDRNVFAVGENGTILRYDGDGDDDGNDDYLWELMTSGTNENLNGVWGSSDTNVFAVGENGTILRYDGDGDDNGVSDNLWEPMESGISKPLHSVWGNSPRNVFAVGYMGMVLRYNGNPDMIWSKLLDDWPDHTQNLNGVWVSDNPHVFVIGEGGIGGYLPQKYGIEGKIIDACDGTRLEGAEIHVWQEINQQWQWVYKGETVDQGEGESPAYDTIEFDDEQNLLKFSKDPGHDYEEINAVLKYEKIAPNDTYLLPLNGYQGCIAGVITVPCAAPYQSYYCPLGDVVVNLYKAVGCEFPSTPDVVFDEMGSDGHYYFTGQSAGTYKVEPVLEGYTFTPQYPGLLHTSPQAYDFIGVPAP